MPLPALVPLETLPGWPAVQEPTAIELLTLTLFIPLAITAVVMLLTMARGWKSPDRG
ncbi:MAG TPA: hypothetical protein PLL50_10140 [Propionicimonas sp.]|nr:hypothetical protein [Propionicimonas sp.]HQA78701.1 hypothetical protein [Propionicimonas sp.]HQD96370.1 hypothetical protein [Propionicimonas sp.]